LRRILEKHPQIEVVAINDLGPAEVLAHLLKYDSSYGALEGEVKIVGDKLVIKNNNGEREIRVFCEKEPSKLPWLDLGVEIVLECTGVFTEAAGAGKHLQAGAKRVIISAPSKSAEVPTYLLGVNEKDYCPEKDYLISMGSCTTNCLAPLAKVLDEAFGIEWGFMTTVHSYTNDQRILDLEHKDLRRARAAGLNIIPTTTGAAKTVEKCLPQLKGKLDGLALRVPTATVSITDFVALLKKKTTADEVNNVLRQRAEKSDLKGILRVEEAPLVSTDYKGESYSAVIDALSTQVKGSLVKVLAWYDNEWGYACRLAELTVYLAGK